MRFKILLYNVKKSKISNIFISLVIFALFFMSCTSPNKFKYSEFVEKNVTSDEFVEIFFSMENKKDYKCDLPIFVENNGDCGFVKVPKDYEDEKKGTYNIFWYVFKSENKKNKKDPIVLLPGGPGLSGTSRIDVILNTGIKGLRKNHDIYSIDFRSVGLSDPYTKELFENCELLDEEKNIFEKVKNLTKSCKIFLNENKDVFVNINSETIAKDILRFLETKKIEKAILYGQSYGTLVALITSKISQGRISGSILDGSVFSGLNEKNQNSDALKSSIYSFLESYKENEKIVYNKFGNFEKRIDLLSQKMIEPEKALPFYNALRTISIFAQDKYRFVIADKILTMFENDNIESFSNLSLKISKYNKDYEGGFLGSEYEKALFKYHLQGIYFLNIISNRPGSFEKIPTFDNSKLDENVNKFLDNNVWGLISFLQELKKIMKFSYPPFENKYGLENNAVPSLILVGSRDIQTPIVWSKYIDSKLKNSKLFIIQNGPHVLTRINKCGVELMRKFTENPNNIQNVEDICVSKINEFHNNISYNIVEFETLLNQ